MKKLLWIFFIISIAIVGCGFSNDEPVIDQLTIPKDAAPGDSLDFQVTAHDADGDALTYSWIVNGTPLREKTPTVAQELLLLKYVLAMVRTTPPFNRKR